MMVIQKEVMDVMSMMTVMVILVTIAALVTTTHSGISHHGKSPECQSDSSLCK